MSQFEPSDNLDFIRHVLRANSPTVARHESRIKELEELLDLERDSKARLEKTNAELFAQLEEETEKMQELAVSSSQYNELIRRRDADVQRLRKELEQISLQAEFAEQDARKKSHHSLMELQGEIDGLQKHKLKVDNEKMMLLKELEVAFGQVDAVAKSKVAAEAKSENLEAQNLRYKSQIDELEKQIRETNATRSKLHDENMEFRIQLKEVAQQICSVRKSKAGLETQLEEMKKLADEETRAREIAQAHLHQAHGDNEQLRLQAEDAADSAHRLQAQLAKTASDLAGLRAKHDKDMFQKTEEFEELKRKSTARTNELLEDLARENMKLSSTEKARQQLSLELNELYSDIDKISCENEALLRDLRSAEILNKELSGRLHDSEADLAATRSTLAKTTSENSRLKVLLDEEEQKSGSLAKENSGLQGSLKEEREHGRALHRELSEVQAARGQLEADRLNLVAALDETKELLLDAEHKHQASQSALAQLRSDMEQRLREKDEEVAAIKKATQRTIDELTASIADVETKCKAELARLKKKYEAHSRELQAEIADQVAQNARLADEVKEYSSRVLEIEQALADERRDFDVLQDKLASAEKRRSQMQGDLEDSNRLLETSDKARKKIQFEIEEVSMKLADYLSQINSLANEKHKLDSELTLLRNELDDAVSGKADGEDKLLKMGAEVARLTDEIRHEQDNVRKSEAARKATANEMREAKLRFEGRESAIAKDGQKAAQLFQDRIKDLESELEAERARSKEAQVQLRKLDRTVREVQQQADEDRRGVLDLQQLLDAAHGKVKTYKRQIDELEGVNAENLKRYKRTQQLLEEAEHRTFLAERRAGAASNHFMNQAPSAAMTLSTSYSKTSSGTR